MSAVGHSYYTLDVGDPAPWFTQRASSNPRYVFDTAAGRYVVLCFHGSTGLPGARDALDAVIARRGLFDDARACFFGVTVDPADETGNKVEAMMPGIRHIYDFDGSVSRRYGVLPVEAKPGEPAPLRRAWVVLDPTLRVLKITPLTADGAEAAEVLDFIAALPPPARFAGVELQAPVLLLPNVFEPELCRRLIADYERDGGQESGFMRQIDGRTVLMQDASHKKRKDFEIVDPELIRTIQTRFRRRVAPEIQKVHQFHATRMERYIVGCYAAEDAAHFRAHRDNTTAGTAHRRFAVSVNLNEDFDGGEVSFPEYGPRSFKAPAGGAVVFSCSLLHAVSRVTRGRRYVFLPFLYDDAAAKVREANAQYLDLGQRTPAAPTTG
ncbi:2OG-Fe(II) oxygenase [Methylopila henanensis]|uniref:2OG-Fe(II) oxygenase n=1 Tax=Methylopila henanensis TaxID=873516 RepID=A0ABW4K3N7_9HYPH